MLMATHTAWAYDFALSKNVATGTLTFTDSNPAYGVSELVVEGEGFTAGTTLPGWSATAFLFSDPLNCLPAIGSTIESGFCYLLTDPTAGAPITGGTTTFTYDPSFDDPSLPSEFAVVFDEPGGGVGACFGQTGGGCNVSVAEPSMSWTFLAALLGVMAVTTQRKLRGRAN